MNIIFLTIWFILPAGFANIFASISAALLPRLNYPMDCYKCFRGKRIFGCNKTWRGLIIGTIFGEIIFILQKFLYIHFPSIKAVSLFDYKEAPLFIGIVFGVGALLGDLVKSFLKRQMNIAPGKSLFVFDQIDWLIGSLVLVSFFITLPLSTIIITLGLGFVLHIVVKFIGYLLGIDRKQL